MNILYLKWCFPLPHYLLDNIFYLRTVCRTILSWEFGVGTMNIYYSILSASPLVRQYLPFKNGLSHNLVLKIWGWYNEYPLFEMVFPVSPWVVRQYLLFRNGLSHTLVLRIWGWYNEYPLFEMVFSALPWVATFKQLVVTSISSNFQDVLHATLPQPSRATSKTLQVLRCNIHVQ